MENLVIEATQHTPSVILSADGNLAFKGKSYSENTFEFYKPILSWIEEYFNADMPSETIVNFELVYFNSSSSKVLFDIFDIFETNINKTKITINWLYSEEDESSMEDGEDFQDSFEDLNIKLLVI